MDAHSLDSIPVSQIMTSPVKTANEVDTVRKICQIMVDSKIGSIIIVKSNDNSQQDAVGIVTERDIVRHIAERPISFEAPVVQIMSKPLITMYGNGSLADALQTMQNRDIRRIAVVVDAANNKLVGIVTDKDIFRFIANNESIASTFVNEELLAKDKSRMAERLSTNTLHNLIQKKA
jgi:CBS domain-containing protein